MDIYADLNLTVAPGKEQPGVWISRVVIFERLSSEPSVIREVKLSRGLNIVWAEEPDDDNTTTEIKGHSAGKTSFCRLLRYVLGESTFGTKANSKLIEHALPGAYVGAELHVLGKPWAVLRPLDTNRRSYVKAEANIEDVVADRRSPLGHDEYVRQLGLAGLLDPLETATIVRTDQPIRWDHVLAWCTRDQEARFQNSHEWRSAKSESEWPAFKASKTDALFVMRAVLGLFLPDELIQEEELAAKGRSKEALAARVADLQREPQFRVNLYTQALRARLGEAYPSRTDIDRLPFVWDQITPDLTRLTENAVRRLLGEIRAAEHEQSEVQDQIDAVGADIAWWEREHRMLTATSGVATGGAAEVRAGLDEAQRLEADLEQLGLTTCRFGGVLIGKCEHVLDRRSRLSIPRLRDAQALEQAEAARRADQEAADERLGEAERQLTDLRQRRKELFARREQLASVVSGNRHSHDELASTLASLNEWITKQNEPGRFEELDSAKEQLRNVTEEIDRAERSLTALLAQHDTNREQIAAIFSKAVQSVLSSGTYRGRVSLSGRELSFYVEHGTAMSGEAIETLSVLLADVACMVYSSVSERVLLPGFVLHDSPREADLSRRLYRGFIRFVASLQEHFASDDECPFQYIMTTTTNPPEALQGDRFVKLRLNAGTASQLLFGRSLGSADRGGAEQLPGLRPPSAEVSE